MKQQSGFEDIILGSDQVAVFNESVKSDALSFLNNRKSIREGAPVKLLGQQIRIPPKRDIFSYVKFINGLYESNTDVVNNQGSIFFDFYDYNLPVDVFFRCLERGLYVYSQLELYEKFSRIYTGSQRHDVDVKNDYSRMILSLTGNRIIQIDGETICFTDKGIRILRVIKGVASQTNM